jgi:hypothetical protein
MGRSGRRREVVVDAVLEAGQVHGFFEQLLSGVQRCVQSVLQACQGGHDNPGMAEGGQNSGLGLQRQVTSTLGGSQDTSEQHTQEVDLAGEVVGGSGVEPGTFGGGEVAPVEGGPRRRGKRGGRG